MKYLVVTLIILLPGPNACYHQNTSRAVIKVDCTKSTILKNIPGSPNITTVTSHCKDYQFDPDSLKMALDIFVQEYADQFVTSKIAVREMLKNLKIEVSAIPRTVHAAYGINGKYLKGNIPVAGLALSKNHIWVEVKTSQIWSSALVHELIHIIIWRKNIVHGDPDHEGKEFSGWTKEHTKLIERINKILLDTET